MKTKFLVFIISVVLCSEAFSQNWNPGKFNVNYIMNAMKNPKSDIYPVVAHRGYWRGPEINSQVGCCKRWWSENSIQSIKNAAAGGLEAVELDIRSSKDNVLYLIHDKTVGRTTGNEGDYNARFDPITGIATGVGNAPINSLTSSYINRNIRLAAWDDDQDFNVRPNPDGSITPLIRPLPTLESALRWIKANAQMVVVLDIFSTEDFYLSVKLVEKLGMFDYVIFKIGHFQDIQASDLPAPNVLFKNAGLNPGTVASKRFNYAIICYEDSPANVYKYIDYGFHEGKDQFIFAELVNKQFISTNKAYKNYSPQLTKYARIFKNTNHAVGQYWAVPTTVNYKGKQYKGYFDAAGGHDNVLPTGKKTVAGQCCVSPNYGFLEGINNLLEDYNDAAANTLRGTGVGASVITSDNGMQLARSHAANRRRNVNWYKCGKANCGRTAREEVLTDSSLIANMNAAILQEENQSNKLEQSLDPINADLILLYPNPTKEVLNVQFMSQSSQELVLNIISMDGKTVITQSFKAEAGINSFQINVKDLSNGLYFLCTNIDNQPVCKKFQIGE